MGKGFSSVAIVGGKAFTMSGRKDGQYVVALDLATQKELWAAKVGEKGGEPRCTPTVSDGLVYALGTEGDLVCVEAASGREVWRKNFANDFGGKMMSGWHYSESPLVDGEKLIVTPGGNEAAIVALNRKTGATIWKTELPETRPQRRRRRGLHRRNREQRSRRAAVRAAHRSRRDRRDGRRRQAALALQPRRQRHREHSDAARVGRLRLLLQRLRHRRGAAQDRESAPLPHRLRRRRTRRRSPS